MFQLCQSGRDLSVHGRIYLGVAGLLKGRHAITHWAFTELLPMVGATEEEPEAHPACVTTFGG